MQGMLRMMERNVSVEVKGEQGAVTKKLFSECEREFSKVMMEETGREMESHLSLSGYSLEEQNSNIIGGVFLRSSEGVIVCDNSIDSRVRLIFEQLLPQIRAMLFPPRRQ